MEPTEAKNTANEKLTHNKENTGKEAGTVPKEKIVLESGKNSSDKDKNGYKERLKEITAVLHKFGQNLFGFLSGHCCCTDSCK